jgi:hypothetical protein
MREFRRLLVRHRWALLSIVLCFELFFDSIVSFASDNRFGQSEVVVPKQWSVELGKLYPDGNAMLKYIFPIAKSPNRKAQLVFASFLLISPKEVHPIGKCNSRCLFKVAFKWMKTLSFDKDQSISSKAKLIIIEFRKLGPHYVEE